MTFLNTYQNYLIKLYLKNLVIITAIFASLTFILNILEEIKFFEDLNLDITYSLFFTFLNMPSILFEIFPFIILISTQMFFMHLYSKDEITIFKNYGIKNTDIIKIISSVTFFFGLFLILGFYTLSSNLKYNYLSFKNTFTDDNKYLAVINENGLWIKDEVENIVNIINAEKIENNLLKNVSISQIDSDYNFIKNIVCSEIDISTNNWLIKDATIFEIDGKKQQIKELNFKSNFDLSKINNLFSNLSSLNLYQLKTHYDDYKSLGYSTLDIESYINKLLSVPFYLVIMIIIGSVLMLNTKYNKSKIFNIIVGVMISVSIYYINYFFNIMGTNERLPIFISIWFPLIILTLISTFGLLKINDK